MKYCEDTLTFHRRKTREVMVGHVGVGGDNPIRIQSMTISDTLDTDATVAEVIQLAEAGCEIVRITAPSMKEAENLKHIKAALLTRGVDVPLVADIHFTPNAALIAAEFVEKVRINPGNYADKKRFEQRDYTEDEYAEELERIEEKFKPLVLKCKQLKRAMRIGTNHGSLSDRIMNRYGDTAEGMVASALEFVNICRKYNYHEIILSMKSSNPLVAIQAYRLLAAKMDALGMDYPFHLGVTEAGDGAEGRIKSAVGIGGLLEDGIGDTIRVSLTEDAVAEVPVAAKLAERYNGLATKSNGSGAAKSHGIEILMPDPFVYSRREALPCDTTYHKIGGQELPRVEMTLNAPISETSAAVDEIGQMLGKLPSNPLQLLDFQTPEEQYKVEVVHIGMTDRSDLQGFRDLKLECAARGFYLPFAIHAGQDEPLIKAAAEVTDRLVVQAHPGLIETAVLSADFYGKALEFKIDAPENRGIGFFAEIDELLSIILRVCERCDFWNIAFSLNPISQYANIVHDYRFLSGRLETLEANFPIVLRYKTNADYERDLLSSASQLGALLGDGIGDSLHIESRHSPQKLLNLMYNLLQATRLRISKTEYISCPSCGRTLFNLQTTTERIKSKTSHLKGVKIAIMGCIVNGPGEMADADFGYVGSGPGKVNLFVGKECVERNIPEKAADERLIKLIKEYGRWVEPQN